jgi:hypothetical protein
MKKILNVYKIAFIVSISKECPSLLTPKAPELFTFSDSKQFSMG